MADKRSRRQILNDWALLGVNGLLIVITLTSMRRDGEDITPKVVVAAVVISFTLLMFLRRHRLERNERD